MKFKKVIASFETDNILLAEELICDIFFSFNLKGVICDIPIEEPDEGFGTNTIPLPDENAIIGFLPDTDTADIIISKIQEKLTGLAPLNIEIRVTIETVDEKDWAEAWKAYFNVTRITDRIVIKPEWKDHTPLPGDIVIHLDPGMAFGTGTHPTTAMCLRLIENFMNPGASFLDVGCGSGILMIAAAKLGAKSITGLDTDSIATGISRENLEINQVEPNGYTLYTAPLDQTPNVPYDMVAANIIAQVIVDIAGEIKQRLARDGTAVLSGIIKERKPNVLCALAANNLKVVREVTEEEWVALAVTHQGVDPVNSKIKEGINGTV